MKPIVAASRKFKISIGALGVLITTSSLAGGATDGNTVLPTACKTAANGMSELLKTLESEGRLNTGDITVMAGCGSTGTLCGCGL